MWLNLLLRVRSAPTFASTLALVAMLFALLDGNLALGQQVQRGRDLFAHRWEPNDKLSPNGDGLGPLFNGKSCRECHSQGGLGGGGPAQNNVDVISTQETGPASNLHPGFASGATSLVLHKFGTMPEYERWRYRVLGFKPNGSHAAQKQLRMLAALEQRKRLSKPVVEYQSNHVPMVLSHRNTPALFGAGLLDEIPEEVIRDQGRRLSKQFPAVSGRLSGRFGWRGHVDSLEEFVLGACANEVGLQFERHKQPPNPFAPKPVEGNDLSPQQADDLIKFVASLPAPRRVTPTHAQAALVVRNGQQLFHTVGCTACHVADLGDVQDVYSDLLLHDMGPDLADPMPARVEGQTITHVAVYGGTFPVATDIVRTNIRQEWRTPPLWGVAESAPYLHDGRAANLDEAIRLHGGEASFSAQRYIALDAGSQSRIVAFLQTMRVPR